MTKRLYNVNDIKNSPAFLAEAGGLGLKRLLIIHVIHA